MSKSNLAVMLSKLRTFDNPKSELEQYPTDSEVAAEILWFAHLNNDIYDKTVADLGAGTGTLGIGCLLLGAKKVYFIEKDPEAIEILKENIKTQDFDGEYEIINSDIRSFHEDVDLVVENPPFGTQEDHADKLFLERAVTITNTVYTYHKLSTEAFIHSFTKSHSFKITHFFKLKFPLKKTMKHHKKQIEYIDVGCWRIHKS
mgnify:CR=1 FL=1|jgi:putative methylase